MKGICGSMTLLMYVCVYVIVKKISLHFQDIGFYFLFHFFKILLAYFLFWNQFWIEICINTFHSYAINRIERNSVLFCPILPYRTRLMLDSSFQNVFCRSWSTLIPFILRVIVEIFELKISNVLNQITKNFRQKKENWGLTYSLDIP